ncbi:MAG: hypothetical protein ACLUYV_05280 [Alistipes shahii]
MARGTSCADDYAVPDYSRPASNTIAFRSLPVGLGEGQPDAWTEESRIGFLPRTDQFVHRGADAAAISVGEPLGLFYTKPPWPRASTTFISICLMTKPTLRPGSRVSLGATQFQNGVSAAHIAQSALAYAAVTSVETENPVAVTLRHVFGYPTWR